tara:strand:+ start:777 stop:1616 length:840 start_codon:yes stop_codon:yes gene_type:complete
MEKYDLIPKQLIYEGTFSKNDFITPKIIDENIILMTHDKQYVKKIFNLKLDESEIRKVGFPLTKKLIERERIIASGTLEGSIKALKDGISMNIAGGTHHAFYDRGEAFCLLNDQAIAAKYLINNKLSKKILIIDLDVHQGNGTAKIFKNNDTVFTFSMHGKNNFPFKKEESNLDIGLPDKISDEKYLKYLKNIVPKLIKNVKPDFIFYLCGVDILETDKLGRLSISIDGCKERDRYILSVCKKNRIPVQCSMGGGYSEDLRIIIEAHSNTFRQAKNLYC